MYSKLSATESSAVMKLECDRVIKRIRAVPQTFDALQGLIIENFPLLKSKPFRITYKDGQEDLITVTNNEDINEAYLDLKESQKPILKFFITQKERENTIEETKHQVIHHGIICDSCEMHPIKGIRFKCKVCPDYDLCATCMKEGIHREHEMMKIEKVLFEWKEFVNKLVPGLSEELARTRLDKEIGAGIEAFTSLISPLASRVANSSGNGDCGLNLLLQGLAEKMKCFQGIISQMQGQNKEEIKETAILIEGEAKRTVRMISTPNTIFIAEWKLKNISKHSWPPKVTTTKVSGNMSFAPIESQGGHKPGDTIDLNVPVTAPGTPGKHSLQLVVKDDNGKILAGPLNVQLTIVAEECDYEGLWYKATEMANDGLGTIEECYNRLLSDN